MSVLTDIEVVPSGAALGADVRGVDLSKTLDDLTADGRVLGDTLFASAVAAYDDLDDATRTRLKGLRVRHDVAGRRRKTGTSTEQDKQKYEAKEKVVHPVVRTHPYTGKKLLYVSDGECDHIEGMADDETAALIARLQKQIVREDHIYRHRWQAGDVLIWDNCAVQHLAIHDYHHFDPPLRRMMWRITVGHTDVYE